MVAGGVGLLTLLVLTGVLAWGNRRLNVVLKEQVRAKRQLRVTANVFSSAREGIVITDAHSRIIDVNPAFTQITGYRREEAMGRNPSFLGGDSRSRDFWARVWQQLNDTGVWDGEIDNRRPTGEAYTQLTTITAIRGNRGHVLHYIAVFTDVTEQKAYAQRLKRLAFFDDLTGLPNRAQLNECVARWLDQVRAGTATASVAYIDLDGFKAINDRFGHHMGDQFLQHLSTQLRTTLRDTDTLARLGGDEFVVVLTDHTPKVEGDPRLLALLQCLSTPIEIDGQRLQVSGSIGVVACTSSPDEDADQLTRLADQAMYQAMYQAKQQGRNRYQIFDRARNVVEQDAHDLRRRMAEGLQRSEFVLFYQPKVHMRLGQVVGVEALIRWQHPERGLLPPGAFLDVAMGHDIDIDLGRWVIAQALRQLRQWSRLGIHLPVSVNVSGAHLQHPGFIDELRALLLMYPDLPSGSLELEVLESSALADVGSVSQVIRLCDAMGVSVALDDFGTGYSSLTYLKQLPAHTRKIDQSFVRTMLTEREDLSILQGVLGLAEAFNRQAIAEGVETPMHGLMLLQLGCEWGQGFGIARPMPAQDIPLWMAQWQPPAAWRAAQAREGLTLDVLVASVHWCGWMDELMAYLTGGTDQPPPMDDPVSPLVTALDEAARRGLAEGVMHDDCSRVVADAHQAVALRLAGQTDLLQACIRSLQLHHDRLHAHMRTLGYWT